MKMQRVGWPLTHTHTRGCSTLRLRSREPHRRGRRGGPCTHSPAWTAALSGWTPSSAWSSSSFQRWTPDVVLAVVGPADMAWWVGVGDSRREELWPSSAAVCWRRRRSNNPGSSPRVRWTWNREERYVVFTIAGIGADYAFMEHVLGGRIFGRVYVGRTVIANC